MKNCETMINPGKVGLSKSIPKHQRMRAAPDDKLHTVSRCRDQWGKVGPSPVQCSGIL